MGASSFQNVTKGTDATELFNKQSEEARYMHGHGGYTGTIAEKPGYEMRRKGREVLDFKEAQEWADNDCENNDKWGPAYAIPYANTPGGEIVGYIFYGYASE